MSGGQHLLLFNVRKKPHHGSDIHANLYMLVACMLVTGIHVAAALLLWQARFQPWSLQLAICPCLARAHLDNQGLAACQPTEEAVKGLSESQVHYWDPAELARDTWWQILSMPFNVCIFYFRCRRQPRGRNCC
jgi:hypothetical protein